MWQITQRGSDFLNRELKVRPVAMIYNKECLRLHGKYRFVDQLLNLYGFDYEELMSDAMKEALAL